MAFTKAPEYNTHQTVRLGPKEVLQQPSYNSITYSTERQGPAVKNGYFVKDKEKSFVHRFPGSYSAITTLVGGAVTVDGLVYAPGVSDYIFAAIGENLYRYDLSIFQVINFPFNAASAGRKKGFADFNFGVSTFIACVEPNGAGGAGSKVHYFTTAGATYATAVTIAEELCPQIVAMDGYLFVATYDKQRIYNSTIGTPTTFNTSVDFIDAEMRADQIKAISKHHNHLVVFGSQSIEFFYNAGNELGSPLSRQLNYSVSIGIEGSQNQTKMVEIGDVIYFIGVNSAGGRGLYKIEKFQVTRVEHNLLDWYLNGASLSSPQQATQTSLSLVSLLHEVGIIFSANSVFPATLLFLPSLGTVSELVGYVPGPSVILKSGTAVYNATNALPDTSLNIRVFAFGDYSGAVKPLTKLPTEIWISDEGYGNNNYKHTKWVDVNGMFQGNAVSLGVVNGYDYDASASPTRTLVQNGDNPLRFRNLGRARRKNYVVTISGNQEALFYDLEVAYNLGSY